LDVGRKIFEFLYGRLPSKCGIHDYVHVIHAYVGGTLRNYNSLKRNSNNASNI
jgi:hypothetical protein